MFSAPLLLGVTKLRLVFLPVGLGLGKLTRPVAALAVVVDVDVDEDVDVDVDAHAHAHDSVRDDSRSFILGGVAGGRIGKKSWEEESCLEKWPRRRILWLR